MVIFRLTCLLILGWKIPFLIRTLRINRCKEDRVIGIQINGMNAQWHSRLPKRV